MINDQRKWDSIFSSRNEDPESSLPRPPALLDDYMEYFWPGPILDLACGDGAASLAISRNGIEVHGVDVSPVGLDRLSKFANHEGLAVKTLAADLDHPNRLFTENLISEARYAAITALRFKATLSCWQTLIPALKPGGYLVIASFNMAHSRKTGFNPKFCLREGEYLPLSDTLDCMHYRQTERSDGNFDEYLFCKPLP